MTDDQTRRAIRKSLDIIIEKWIRDGYLEADPETGAYTVTEKALRNAQ